MVAVQWWCWHEPFRAVDLLACCRWAGNSDVTTRMNCACALRPVACSGETLRYPDESCCGPMGGQWYRGGNGHAADRWAGARVRGSECAASPADALGFRRHFRECGEPGSPRCGRDSCLQTACEQNRLAVAGGGPGRRSLGLLRVLRAPRPCR